MQIKVRKTNGTIKNGQPTDTSNIGNKTQNEDKQNKNTTQKTKKDEQHGQHQKIGDEPMYS